jgi:hypothetical protein
MFKKIGKFKTVTVAFALSFLFIVGGWFWTYIRMRGINQPLIIHFNNYAGITRIGNLTDLAAVGMLGLIIVLMNFLLALNLEERDWFLGKLLAATTLLMGILIFIGFAAIISVN